MNLKPPLTRTGRSGWLGQATRLKSLVVVGALTFGFAGAAIAASVPASADPAFQFIQVGSDTTEYVMNAFADSLGNNVIGEYDATNPETNTAGETITPQVANPAVAGEFSSCSFARPNGSGAGFKAMDTTYFPGNGFGVTPAPQPGCINISRSSSPPGSVTTGSCSGPGSLCSSGNFVYIPFAVDVVTYATGPTATTTAAYAFTASNGTFTLTSAPYVANNTVELTGTSLPAGFSTGTLYYVVNPSGDTFQLATSFNGTAITTTGSGSGTVQFESTTLCIPALDTTTSCTAVNGADVTTYTSAGTSITQGLNLTVANLQTLYESCQPLTVGTTTLNPGTEVGYSATATAAGSPETFTVPTGTPTAGQTLTILGTPPGGFTAGTPYFVVNLSGTTFNLAATSGGTAINATATTSVTGNLELTGNVDLYAPQAGSGTLAFWELEMGNLTAVQSCWHQTIVAGPAIGVAVEEHDGSAFYSDPHGIGPISAGRWVAAQAGNDPDLRHGDVLQDISPAGSTTGVSPLNSAGTAINVAGCLASGVQQATCFPVTRELYNVMDYFEVTGNTETTQTGNPTFNSTLASLFAGGTSAMCQSAFQIHQQGFATIATTSNFPDLCGATTSDLRVQMNGNGSTGG